MFTGIIGKIVMVQTVLLLALGAGSYFYFRHSQAVIAGLNEEKAVLETTVQTQTATIAAQEDAARRQNTESLRLQQSLVDAETSRRAVEQRLRSRNLEALARANSADLEQRLNRETSQLFREIELLTRPQHQNQNPSPQTQVDTLTSSTGNINNQQPPPRPPKQYGGAVR
jgi:flagellar basal body-associated protein FliL